MVHGQCLYAVYAIDLLFYAAVIGIGSEIFLIVEFSLKVISLCAQRLCIVEHIERVAGFFGRELLIVWLGGGPVIGEAVAVCHMLQQIGILVIVFECPLIKQYGFFEVELFIVEIAEVGV